MRTLASMEVSLYYM